MLKYIALACATVFMAGSAQSAELERVSISFASQHVGLPDTRNETNPGVFFTWGDVIGPIDITAGAYVNSYSNTSALLTTSYDFLEWDDGALGIFMGAAFYPEHGMRKFPCCGGFIPMGGLQLRQGNLFAQVIPMNGEVVKAVVTLGLTFELE